MAMRLKRPQAALGCSRRVPQKSVRANMHAIHLSVRAWSPQSPGFLRGDSPARTAARPRHVVGDQEHWHARRGRDQRACRRRARYARLLQCEPKAPFARHLPAWHKTSGPGPPVAAPHHPAAPRRLARAERRRGPPRVLPRGPPAPAWSRPTRAFPAVASRSAITARFRSNATAAVQDQSARSFQHDSAIQGCLLSISGSGFCP